MSETPETKFTISVQMEGFPVNVEFTGNGKKLREVIAGLKSIGATPPPARSFGGFGSKPQSKPLTQPLVNDHGDPCCTVHTQRNGQPLPIRYWEGKDGRPGFWGCMSKAQGVQGEQINDRGYCSLRFDWPAPSLEKANGRT